MSHLSRRLTVSIVLLGALTFVNCASVDGGVVDGDNTSELSKSCVSAALKEDLESRSPPRAVERNHPRAWGWIAATDRGIRQDSQGDGRFGMGRSSGLPHAGIDFDFPVGTKLIAPCAGTFERHDISGFGNTVVLACKVPSWLASSQVRPIYVSILFGHMAERASGSGANVAVGDYLGTVGKSGNASSPSIDAHVHLQVTVHGAMTEALAGHSNDDAVNDEHSAPALALEKALTEGCMLPEHFRSTNNERSQRVTASGVRLGRLIDPYVLITCLGREKPAPEMAAFGRCDGGEKRRWGSNYAADAFSPNTWRQKAPSRTVSSGH